MVRKRLVWVLVAGLALGLPVGWYLYAPRTVPDGQPPLATLSPAALDAFRDNFNGAVGQVRVIILLSPT